MVSNTSEATPMELSPKRDRRSPQTGKMLLVPAQLYVQRQGMVLCRDGARDLFITNPDGTRSLIDQEEVTVSKKTLGIHDSPAGENEGHLKYIQEKASTWTSRMINGHLPHHMAWVA
jgi:hypothetical protein